MVKTNTFNGVPLPSIWLWDSETDSSNASSGSATRTSATGCYFHVGWAGSVHICFAVSCAGAARL
jgi:hypothetical protein